MERTLKEMQDLSGAEMTAMVIGEVQHMSVAHEYAEGYQLQYGKDGYMILIPALQNLLTGESSLSAVAAVKIEKYD